MWEQQLPTAPSVSRFNLAPGFPTLCQDSPVGNTSLSTFPHLPGAKPSPVTPSFHQ